MITMQYWQYYFKSLYHNYIQKQNLTTGNREKRRSLLFQECDRVAAACRHHFP
ncbi:hypothetical protein [Planktothrix mougeotii]|uniref:Transposase n=1 Tax=Planktothrix mougeotii LEGE 06226 TaxID=1828728 RepID=A0ABR9U6P2_9CYAN|nr:hypothetical protein [Planktothrix mougeotii]MBE9142128.1 hypothetical protein [Planktothrix mougeotii LEGE 06226]